MDKLSINLLQASQQYLPDPKFMQFVGSSTSTTSTITTPSSTQIGDIIVIVQHVCILGVSLPSVPTPIGFTHVNTAGNNNYYPPNYYSALLTTSYKKATANGAQSIAVTTSSNGLGAMCAVFRPVGITYSSIVVGGWSSGTTGWVFAGYYSGSNTSIATVTNPVAILGYADFGTIPPQIST